MHTNALLAATATAAVMAVAAACGTGASANGGSGSAAVSTGSGSTTVSGSAAGHSFSAQLSSLTGLVDRLTRLSGSAGSGQVASSIGHVRSGLGRVRASLTQTAFPSLIKSQKQRLIGFLGRWDGDLGRAQASARNGNTRAAIREARSSTYRDLRSLLDTLSAASIG